MSRKDIQKYTEAAKTLAKRTPLLKKLSKRKTLKIWEKAYIARNAFQAKQWKRPARLENEDYANIVREWIKFIPKFERFRGQQEFDGQERAYIRRIQKILHETYTGSFDLIVPKEKQKFEEFFHEPESIIKSGKRKGQFRRHHFLEAMQLRNVGDDVEIIDRIGDNILITSNKRVWVYWRLPNTKPRTLEQYGTAAFVAPDEFDIQRVVELAEKAFAQAETKAVYLWANAGRVGFGYKDLSSFVRWLIDDYSKYVDTEKWVKGIAILVADVDDHISPQEFASFSLSREERIERQRRNREQYRRKRR